jgi:ketosteroid isomerase-like protein
MTLRTIAVCLSLGPAILVAQYSRVDSKADEAAIRALIAKEEFPPSTEDRIAWSGASKRPSVGPKRGEVFPEAQLEKRKNTKATTSVQRLEIAKSGDMAWEFSYGKIEYDVDETHHAFERATLRVWTKVDGQWKAAASFTRPLDVPFAPH